MALPRTIRALLGYVRPVTQGRLTDRIVFVHIPKCGGTSIHAAVAQAYGLRMKLSGAIVQVLSDPSSELARLRGMPLHRARETVLLYAMAHPGTRFISGHFPFSLTAWKRFGAEWQHVTVLRDPVDRWFSEYHYLRGAGARIDGIDGDLETFLSTDKARNMGRCLTRFLGTPEIDPPRDGSENGELTRTDAESAVENLARFAVVGFLDDMPAFAESFRARFGVPLRLPKRNVGPVPREKRLESVPEELLQEVERLCEGDTMIYQRARKAYAA